MQSLVPIDGTWLAQHGHVTKRVLITGGAGFIGSHLAAELLSTGYDVRVLDSLVPPQHPARVRPSYLDREIELHVADVRNRDALRRALDRVDVVIHLAEQVGAGQNMYQMHDHTSANAGVTAALLEALIERPVERLIVASSMSVYGEGTYRAGDGAVVNDVQRNIEDLLNGEWEPRRNGEPLTPMATAETKTPSIRSVYALTRFDQERLVLMIGKTYHIATVAARFFNVYGPRQALSSPNTGALATFASRLLNGLPPRIYEDGGQRRDFVSVYDAARAIRLAIETPAAAGQTFNVGSGESSTVLDIATRMAALLGCGVDPEITRTYRVGDVRHCFADITRARDMLGYHPQVTLDDGLTELACWLTTRDCDDRVADAQAAPAARALPI